MTGPNAEGQASPNFEVVPVAEGEVEREGGQVPCGRPVRTRS